MTKKFTIKIEVDPGEKKITIEDNEGNRKIVSGVALFGGMPDDNAYYLFGWGNSSSAAWAYGKGYAHAWNLDDPYYRNFFKRCAQNIAKIEAPTILRDEKEMNVDELLEFLDKVKAEEDRPKGTVH